MVIFHSYVSLPEGRTSLMDLRNPSCSFFLKQHDECFDVGTTALLRLLDPGWSCAKTPCDASKHARSEELLGVKKFRPYETCHSYLSRVHT